MKYKVLFKAFNQVIDNRRKKQAIDTIDSDMQAIDYDYLSFSYKAGKGHFKVRIHDLVCSFNQTDFKKVVNLMTEDNEGYNKADFVHALLSDISDILKEGKNKVNNIDDKAEYTEALNRCKKLNDILVDLFGIDDIDVEAKPKFSKTTAYKQYKDSGIEVDYNAKSIIMYGYKWIISKNRDIQGTYNIIVPSCGLSCAAFKGNVNKALDIITPELLDKVLNVLKDYDFSYFENLINNQGIDSLPEFKVA